MGKDPIDFILDDLIPAIEKAAIRDIERTKKYEALKKDFEVHVCRAGMILKKVKGRYLNETDAIHQVKSSEKFWGFGVTFKAFEIK